MPFKMFLSWFVSRHVYVFLNFTLKYICILTNLSIYCWDLKRYLVCVISVFKGYIIISLSFVKVHQLYCMELNLVLYFLIVPSSPILVKALFYLYKLGHLTVLICKDFYIVEWILKKCSAYVNKMHNMFRGFVLFLLTDIWEFSTSENYKSSFWICFLWISYFVMFAYSILVY